MNFTQAGDYDQIIDRILPEKNGIFIDHLLSRAKAKNVECADNYAVARYLYDTSLSELGGPIKIQTPENDDYLARMMAAEALSAARRGKAALHWYSAAIQRAIAIASVMHPELKDAEAARRYMHFGILGPEDAKTVLFCAMAITSQNIALGENISYALEQYRHFLANGCFFEKIYGANGSAIANNLARFNQLLDVTGGNIADLRLLLNTPFKMREIVSLASQYGISLSVGEMLDETVYGSVLFGPKIGNGFYQNLCGNYSLPTIDMWLMRSFGRYTGTLLRDTVSQEQVDRLVTSVRQSARGKRMRAIFEENGIPVDRKSYGSISSTELAAVARKLHRIWEGHRRQKIAHGATNDDIVAIKKKLDWPGAASSIIKSLISPVDSPTSATTRKWIRSVINRALSILSAEGCEMTAADLQALLWFPEKDIYDLLANRPTGSLNLSYDTVVWHRAIKEGYDERELHRAVSSLGTDWSGGSFDPNGPFDSGSGNREEFSARTSDFGEEEDPIGSGVDRLQHSGAYYG